MALFRKNSIVQTKKTVPEEILWDDVKKARKKRERNQRKEERRRKAMQAVFPYSNGDMSLKDEIRIWKRRHGHQVVGAILLIVLLAVGWIGYRQVHPKQKSMEELLGFNKLKLSYKVEVDGLDGEMFSYSLYFDPEPDDEKKAQLIDGIMERVYEQWDDDGWYGDVFPYLSEDGAVEIVLDLGNADDERMVQGILKALDGTEGLERVVVNEGIDEYYE